MYDIYFVFLSFFKSFNAMKIATILFIDQILHDSVIILFQPQPWFLPFIIPSWFKELQGIWPGKHVTLVGNTWGCPHLKKIFYAEKQYYNW